MITNTIIGVGITIFLIASLGVMWIKRVPAGWVELKTGLLLKFLPGLDSMPVVKLRESIENYWAKKLPAVKRKYALDHVDDHNIPTRHGQITSRVFRRQGTTKAARGIIFIHGGGWCIGSISTYEEVCRRLAMATDCPVISLDYSLAPESSFPIAHDECLDAVRWLIDQQSPLGLDVRSWALAGDSAGGNLAVSTVYQLNDTERQHIDRLVAIYPVVDGDSAKYESYKLFGKGYYLTAAAMQQFTEALDLSAEDIADLRLNPLMCQKPKNFPKTFIQLAEYDPLRDMGIAFGEKLKNEGWDVTTTLYPGTIHGFYGLGDFGNKGVRAIEESARFITS